MVYKNGSEILKIFNMNTHGLTNKMFNLKFSQLILFRVPNQQPILFPFHIAISSCMHLFQKTVFSKNLARNFIFISKF